MWYISYLDPSSVWWLTGSNPSNKSGETIRLMFVWYVISPIVAGVVFLLALWNFKIGKHNFQFISILILKAYYINLEAESIIYVLPVHVWWKSIHGYQYPWNGLVRNALYVQRVPPQNVALDHIYELHA